MRRRTVHRKFVQSFTKRSSKSARTSQYVCLQPCDMAVSTAVYTLLYMHNRVPLDQAASAALLDVGCEKKTPTEESRGDKGDKKVGHPEDEQQRAAPFSHHPEPRTDLPHPFAESVEVQTAPVATAEQELLLLPDSPPASKV